MVWVIHFLFYFIVISSYFTFQFPIVLLPSCVPVLLPSLIPPCLCVFFVFVFLFLSYGFLVCPQFW